MKKRSTWQSKLTKAELKHLKEDAFKPGVRITLNDLKRLFEAQVEMREKDLPLTNEPCWTCRRIAKKLGFAV